MITKRPLLGWVRASGLKLQMLLLLIIALSVAVRVVPLEMQKRIVNEAIGHRKLQLLFLYCLVYLVAVVAAGALKYGINMLETHIGQQALAKMRRELFSHILTLPLSFHRRTTPGMVVSSLVTEIAPAGDFVGQALAVPVTSVLTFLALTGYMLYLSPLLALLSLVIFPFVIFLAPRMQRRANEENTKRVDTTREFSSRVSEAIAGIHEVHGNGSCRIENRKVGRLVDMLRETRVAWILAKQRVKVLNNFLQNLGPLILFLAGGYLAIMGHFDLGALVAFLSAQEKLYEPSRELMEFYQVYQDSNVSYNRIMSFFDVEPEWLLDPPDREPYDLSGAITVRNLSLTVDDGITLLNGIDLELNPGEQITLVGFSGSGKSTLAHCIGQITRYSGGSVQVDGREVRELTKSDVVRNIGVVPQVPFIFDGTIRENLLYSCEALLVEDGEPDPARLPDLDTMIQAIQEVGLFADLLRFGLNTVLEAEKARSLTEGLIRVRRRFQEQSGEELAEYVEFFDERRYLYFSTVAANLLFGYPNREEFHPERLNANPYFLKFLDDVQLRMALMSLGRDLVLEAVDILGNLAQDELFFRQSPIAATEIEACKGLVARMAKRHLHEFTEEDQSMLLGLALRFTPGVHKLIALPRMIEELVLESRFVFRDRVSRDHPGAVTFYRMSEGIPTQTLLDNILFGKPRLDEPGAQDRVQESLMRLLVEEDLLEQIIALGLDFRVGTRGDRLSGGQRQKLAIARVLLKKPPILILDEATAALDNASQQRIHKLLDSRWKGNSTLISVVHRLDTIGHNDRVAVMKAGRIIEMGTYDELVAHKGVFHELVYGAKSGRQ